MNINLRAPGAYSCTMCMNTPMHHTRDSIQHACIRACTLGEPEVGCPGEVEGEGGEVAQRVGHEKERRYDRRDNVQTPESERRGVRAGVG